MKKVLLDTNAYSALALGNRSVLEAIEKAQQVIISPICVGELIAGFIKGSKESHNRTILSTFLQHSTTQVSPITADTADWYANIFTQLQSAGTLIPINDVWIAAQAMEHGAMLITFDRHFQVVPGLLLWKTS